MSPESLLFVVFNGSTVEPCCWEMMAKLLLLGGIEQLSWNQIATRTVSIISSRLFRTLLAWLVAKGVWPLTSKLPSKLMLSCIACMHNVCCDSHLVWQCIRVHYKSVALADRSISKSRQQILQYSWACSFLEVLNEWSAIVRITVISEYKCAEALIRSSFWMPPLTTSRGHAYCKTNIRIYLNSQTMHATLQLGTHVTSERVEVET